MRDNDPVVVSPRLALPLGHACGIRVKKMYLSAPFTQRTKIYVKQPACPQNGYSGALGNVGRNNLSGTPKMRLPPSSTAEVAINNPSPHSPKICC
jgi:hypothetical protein